MPNSTRIASIRRQGQRAPGIRSSSKGTGRDFRPTFRSTKSRLPPADGAPSTSATNDAPSANDVPPTNNVPMIDVPPPTNDTLMSDAAPLINDASAGTEADVDDSHLTAEEKKAKREIIDHTEAKIKNWLNYQRTHSAADQNPWSKWLRAKLRPVKDERRPRRLLDFQVYMQDSEKNAKINRLFSERYPDHVGTKNSLKFRAEIAREEFEAEPDDVQKAFRRKAEEDFEEAMEWKKDGEEAEEDGGDLNEAARAEARLRLHATVKPFLIAGGVIDGKLNVCSVHAGKVDGKNEDGQDGVDFTRWDPKG
ncbi:hypothetical protein C8F04DRAFT_1274118 [Mycena alexandri]|uniref:Uncharacterized protein n=1 Tax=Mycena alexandri TaxID=1745969 RepID=A0AAD6WQ84_9AGAR|nr:hypothetical protein C8F04DRAFT_1274118 [Mycena alexandri]